MGSRYWEVGRIQVCLYPYNSNVWCVTHCGPVNGAQAKQFGGNAFRLGGEDINTVVSHEITTFFSFLVPARS